MYLKEIIDALELIVETNPEARVRLGFDPASAHSWRGSYSELSFNPATDVSLAEMLEALKSARGKTFVGYKGGDFTMGDYTEVYIDPYSECPGNRISQALIAYWAVDGAT